MDSDFSPAFESNEIQEYISMKWSADERSAASCFAISKIFTNKFYLNETSQKIDLPTINSYKSSFNLYTYIASPSWNYMVESMIFIGFSVFLILWIREYLDFWMMYIKSSTDD